jgi:hypothetical protein
VRTAAFDDHRMLVGRAADLDRIEAFLADIPTGDNRS